MAAAWSLKRRHWPAFLVLYTLVTIPLQSSHIVQAFFHVDHSELNTHDLNINNNLYSLEHQHHSHLLCNDYHLQPATCTCLEHDNPQRLDTLQQCPSRPFPFCLHDNINLEEFIHETIYPTSSEQSDNDNDHIDTTPAASINKDDDKLTRNSLGIEDPYGNSDQQKTFVIHDVYNQETSESTFSTNTGNSEETQSTDPRSEATLTIPDESQSVVSTASYTSSQPSHETFHSESKSRNTQTSIIPSGSTATTVSPTNHPQIERHIPSYEQWRKQVLEKKKPAEANERKQRKRKPYQESAMDVAIGSEEEIEFVFPNLDSGVGNGKNGENRFQHSSDPLGHGPDLKQGLGSEEDLIKAEYSKDPKDRFNHASATCAASVVKASKDATSITAILNEGKDHYMLNKCSTKEKFFVVELCEEILVDTFVLGNYEFFSSTFKNFVVSVNRYPPRDDGWVILGHFQARNTRDAQVFKPAAPQLATYIRFDFLNHYGNEYYCPVTLLRVYGATALEQLKQEEEEEKRLAEEEKRLAELENARRAAAEAEDTEETEDVEEVETQEPNIEAYKDNRTGSNAQHETGKGDQETYIELVETPEAHSDEYQALTHGDTFLPSDGPSELTGSNSHSLEDSHTYPIDVPVETTHPTEYEDIVPLFSEPEESDKHSTTVEEILHMHDPTASQTASPETTLVSFEETTPPSTIYEILDTLPPRVSTSPASIHDEGDWINDDLGMVTLSPKAKSTPPAKPPQSPRPSSGAVGTGSSGVPSATDTSSHPTPSPQHSSQESVYKNIVNRLKVLELNSSLSYQYLEEQSNIFNDILESSEQKINQLVSHLNEATRRLETLGRKYDQLAYSYRAHVEIDGEKKRQEFVNLSAQVHLLVSQVVFQRQIFIVCAITVILVLAFIAINRSTTMHYAIQQSPLGAKLRAMSGHKRGPRSNDIASTVRIGSVEGLTQFDQNSLILHHEDEGIKITPPISPISPLTPGPNHNAEAVLIGNREIHIDEEFRPDSGTSLQAGEVVENGHYSEGSQMPHSDTELATGIHRSEASSLKPLSTSQLDIYQVSRTPFHTPKNSYGPGRLFLHPSNHSQSHQPLYHNDYRPESPVFQGPSGVHDEGQLSDADVAYMSRDMNVGRKGFDNAGPVPISPAMRRLSSSVSSHTPSFTSTARRLSSLRMDTTASLFEFSKTEASDGIDTAQQASDGLVGNDTLSIELASSRTDGAEGESRSSGDLVARITEAKLKEFEDDVGFVSDSVLDSALENLKDSQERMKYVLGTREDRDLDIGYDEATVKRESVEEDKPLHRMPSKTRSRRNTIKNTDPEFPVDMEGVKDRSRLSRESSLKSRQKSSPNSIRSLDYTNGVSIKNNSSSVVGLGLEGVDPEYIVSQQGDNGDSDNPKALQLDKDALHVPQGQGYSERRKKSKKPSLPEDQMVPRRRISYGRRESSSGAEPTEAFTDERGLDGDDERSPQAPRKSSP